MTFKTVIIILQNKCYVVFRSLRNLPLSQCFFRIPLYENIQPYSFFLIPPHRLSFPSFVFPSLTEHYPHQSSFPSFAFPSLDLLTATQLLSLNLSLSQLTLTVLILVLFPFSYHCNPSLLTLIDNPSHSHCKPFSYSRRKSFFSISLTTNVLTLTILSLTANHLTPLTPLTAFFYGHYWPAIVGLLSQQVRGTILFFFAKLYFCVYFLCRIWFWSS